MRLRSFASSYRKVESPSISQCLKKKFADIDQRNKRNADVLERKETIEMADGHVITL